jgi:hypothetical protein
MNAPAVITPAFAAKLPPKGPTLMQRALAAIEAQKRQREHLHTAPHTRNAEVRQVQLDDVQHDTAEEFFDALERETGIDRRLFAKLGDIA